METGTLVVILLLVALFTIIALYFIYNNAEIRLRNEAEAQRKKTTGVFDKMWKVVKQKTQVTDSYKKAFEEIYPKLIAGRYLDSRENMMKWINEDNPDLKQELYLDLVRSIEVLRGEFQHAQERMIDIIREHKTLCETYISKWFISNKTQIEYKVLSSDLTNQTLAAAIENDVDLQLS